MVRKTEYGHKKAHTETDRGRHTDGLCVEIVNVVKQYYVNLNQVNFFILHNIERVIRQLWYRAGPDHTLCLRMLHLHQIKVLEAFGGKRFFSDQSK